MSYDPATYWPARYARQGPSYVAPGGHASRSLAQVEAVAPFLRRYASGRVLDFGCGPQRFRPALEEVCTEYVGADLIPGLGTIPLGSTLPTDFDTATAIYVLQHITDDAAYRHWATQLHACLKPAGRLLVVDCLPRPSMDPHMNPRGLQGLLDAAPWRSHEVVGEHDGHWLGWLRK